MTWREGGHERGVLAVVPARGGSKGIPGKNMKRLGGLTLVGRATQLAASLPWVDQVIVSTDDPEIAAEVMRQGGDAPFLRPEHLASLVEFIVFARGEEPVPREGYRMTAICGQHPASATEIRESAQKNLRTEWLHPAVCHYIQEHRLYRQ